jgi:hypothetical protein
MLGKFDVVIDGFTYKVKFIDRPEAPIRLYRISLYLAHKETPGKIAGNIGGDVEVDLAFLGMGCETGYGRILKKVLEAEALRKRDYPDLVQMVV